MARSAVAIGSRAARIEGIMLPTSPTTTAQRIPIMIKWGETDRLKTLAPEDFWLPLKHIQAKAAPISDPLKVRTSASVITDRTTGPAPKPRARKVAISRARLATAAYIVLRAPNMAPMAMMPPIV